MLSRRYRVVSNSTTAREDLTAVWQLQNGKFDDGIAVQIPVPHKFGPHIKNVMDQMGVSEDDVTTSICRECGLRYNCLSRRCKDCTKKFAEEGQ